MAIIHSTLDEQLVAPWADWAQRVVAGRRLLEAGTYALTEGAIAAGCRVDHQLGVHALDLFRDQAVQDLTSTGACGVLCNLDAPDMDPERRGKPRAARRETSTRRSARRHIASPERIALAGMIYPLRPV